MPKACRNYLETWLQSVDTGQPAPATIARAANHLATCPSCQARLRQLAKALDEPQEDQLSCTAAEEHLLTYIEAQARGKAGAGFHHLQNHLAHCPSCLATYADIVERRTATLADRVPVATAYPAFDLSFLRQGQDAALPSLLQPVPDVIADVQHLPVQPQIATTLTQILATDVKSATNVATLVEKAIEAGRAWLDHMGRWRSIEVALPSFLLGQAPLPALSGMLDDERPSQPATYRTLYISPENADFEIILTVEPDPTAAGHYQVEATITLLNQPGDFSKVEMTLSWQDIIRTAITDSLGKAIFTGLPPDALMAMLLQVTLPESTHS